MAIGSKAFSAPEGSYVIVTELNVHRAPLERNGGTTPVQTPVVGPSTTLGGVVAGNTTLGSISNPPGTGSSSAAGATSYPNAGTSAPPGSTASAVPLVHVPAVPGILANADGVSLQVSPPAYPSSLATVVIRFPVAPPLNPFPHPGFLTVTKYNNSNPVRVRDTNTSPDQPSSSEPSTSTSEQTDSSPSSADDPAVQPPQSANIPTSAAAVEAPAVKGVTVGQVPSTKHRSMLFGSTLSSLASGSPRPTGSGYGQTSFQPAFNSLHSVNSPRPRAAFKGSTSTFIKSAEGMPLSHSVLKTFYGSINADQNQNAANRDEGEDKMFGFYTWNKTLSWVQLSLGKSCGETLCKLNFQASTTCVSVNRFTANSSSIDVLVGFATGDLLYFDPFCGRYTRLNKGGCISSSPVSKIVWLNSSISRRGGWFVSSHLDGTVICWDKDREDFSSFVSEPWPDCPLKTKNNRATKRSTRLDERLQDIVVSKLPITIASDKRNRLNPVCHWRVSKKAIRDIAFSPDLIHCAVVGDDGCLRIVNAVTDKLVDTFMCYFGGLLCVCWSADGRLIFTGGQDDLVTAYAPFEQRVIARCQGHSSFVTGLAYDPWSSDDRSCRFASVSEDCKLIFWDLSNASLSRPRIHHSYFGSRSHSINSAVISPSLYQNRRKMTSDQHLSGAPVSDLMDDAESSGAHYAPGRNEVAILQPVLIKEIGMDPLSSINYHRDWLVIGSRTGQINVFGRPTTSAMRKTETGME